MFIYAIFHLGAGGKEWPRFHIVIQAPVLFTDCPEQNLALTLFI